MTRRCCEPGCGRLYDHDYATPGWYFVRSIAPGTVACPQHREAWRDFDEVHLDRRQKRAALLEALLPWAERIIEALAAVLYRLPRRKGQDSWKVN